MSQPQVMHLDDASQLGPLTRDWLDLATRLDGTSYFQTPDWVIGWWETIAGRPSTRIAAWRAPSGRLEALVVLSRDRDRLHRRLPIGLPVYVNAGSGLGSADHCGWLVGPECRDEVCAWVSEAIVDGGLLLRGADADAERPPIPAGARVVETISCPRLQLRDGDHEVGRSSGFRRQLERFSRRLEEEGLEFEWVPAGAVDERLLTTLFDLHRRGRARHGEGTSFDHSQLALHAGLTGRSGVGRGPAAVVARRRQEVVGVLYGLCWKDVFAAYQSGWDARWARFSMGSVLTHHAIRFAAAHGMRTFDFLRGAEPYKYRFGAVDRCDSTWLVAKGLTGALLTAQYGARKRLYPAALLQQLRTRCESGTALRGL